MKQNSHRNKIYSALLTAFLFASQNAQAEDREKSKTATVTSLVGSGVNAYNEIIKKYPGIKPKLPIKGIVPLATGVNLIDAYEKRDYPRLVSEGYGAVSETILISGAILLAPETLGGSIVATGLALTANEGIKKGILESGRSVERLIRRDKKNAIASNDNEEDREVARICEAQRQKSISLNNKMNKNFEDARKSRERRKGRIYAEARRRHKKNREEDRKRVNADYATCAISVREWFKSQSNNNEQPKDYRANCEKSFNEHLNNYHPIPLQIIQEWQREGKDVSRARAENKKGREKYALRRTQDVKDCMARLANKDTQKPEQAGREGGDANPPSVANDGSDQPLEASPNILKARPQKANRDRIIGAKPAPQNSVKRPAAASRAYPNVVRPGYSPERKINKAPKIWNDPDPEQLRKNLELQQKVKRERLEREKKRKDRRAFQEDRERKRLELNALRRDIELHELHESQKRQSK